MATLKSVVHFKDSHVYFGYDDDDNISIEEQKEIYENTPDDYNRVVEYAKECAVTTAFMADDVSPTVVKPKATPKKRVTIETPSKPVAARTPRRRINSSPEHHVDPIPNVVKCTPGRRRRVSSMSNDTISMYHSTHKYQTSYLIELIDLHKIVSMYNVPLYPISADTLPLSYNNYGTNTKSDTVLPKIGIDTSHYVTQLVSFIVKKSRSIYCNAYATDDNRILANLTVESQYNDKLNPKSVICIWHGGNTNKSFTGHVECITKHLEYIQSYIDPLKTCKLWSVTYNPIVVGGASLGEPGRKHEIYYCKTSTI